MKYLIPALTIALAAPLTVQAEPPQPDFGQAFLQQFDVNKDGRVTPDEFKKPQIEQLDKQFKYMDKNGDGVVDAAEAKAFAQEMQQRMQQMQQQQGGSAPQR